MNFHLNNGIYFRRNGDAISIVRAKDFDDPGELIVETDINGFASIVASASPHAERNGTFYYVFEFLKNGVVFCGGCGCKLTAESSIGGWLSVVNLVACRACYEGKFKPLFDWGLKRAS
jgi:hypothetical protein